jgi:hypothetical protein
MDPGWGLTVEDGAFSVLVIEWVPVGALSLSSAFDSTGVVFPVLELLSEELAFGRLYRVSGNMKTIINRLTCNCQHVKIAETGYILPGK